MMSAISMATNDPFRDLDRLASSLFETRRGPRRMPMDLYRDGDHYVLTADLPGVDPGSVDKLRVRSVVGRPIRIPVASPRAHGPAPVCVHGLRV